MEHLSLTPEEITRQIEVDIPRFLKTGERILVIIPDRTRSAPIPVLFPALNQIAAQAGCHLDYLIALGTHPPLDENEIGLLVGQPIAEILHLYPGMKMMNHRWADPSQLVQLGAISAAEVEEYSGGLMRHEIPVTINRLVLEYDRLLICGPVFPHEVAGFSGGAKYLFPGIAGEMIIHLTHWLGALSTSMQTISVKDTPVRRIIEAAARLVPVPVTHIAFCMDGHETLAVFIGGLNDAWQKAVELSSEVNIFRVPRQYNSVLSQPASFYDEMWTAAKAMYKLESVVRDGGDLIIYAPHLKELSVTHGDLIKEVGYHCRDYFLKQWDRFSGYPLGVLAHSTHLKGAGSFKDGVETPRIQVIQATAIPRETCEKVNLGYMDPLSIKIEDWENQEKNGYLYVPDAGEILYQYYPPR